ncbi:stage II sporulation serine phosphatase for sigma-F activation [Desulfocucumis palustris]|uniref:Stage II sporulation serine phosphatase for sigma-F activation n=1 Tax=Desulfocucumis palustris TaxID=1898651 RepID=A0A2L2X7K1_9FIRM|nr:stage II sporulation protein E [Desulfocucumis palustris]GBF32145.1 stage II sporulation serine phosphatase for sigma-F activation [Desulfocucumis palustris]
MFEKVDVYPYRRKVDDRGEKRSRSFRRPGFLSSLDMRGFLNPGLLPALAAGFCLGRAVLLGELSPFAPAFAAACGTYFSAGTGFLAILAVCSGMATVYTGTQLAAGLSTILGVYFFVRSLPDRYASRWHGPGVVVLALTLSVKAALLSFSGADAYNYINVLFESVFAAALTPALVLSLKSLGGINGVKPLATEEVVCVLTLAAGIIAGTGDIRLWHISVKGVLSGVIIMVSSLAGGAGFGAAAGALAGMIPGLAFTALPLMVGAYSFAGVVSGLGRMLGKAGVILGFLLANVILCVYVNDFSGIAAVVGETLSAAFIFMLIPSKWIKMITFSLSPGLAPEKGEKTTDHVREVLQEKIRGLSVMFREMSRAFSHVSAAVEESSEERDLDALVKEINNKVCHGCGMYRICWEKDYYRTYQHSMEMFATVETFGRVTAEDMPGEFKRRCTRPRELSIAVSCLFDAYKLNRFWSGKLSESRGLVGNQLKGLAGVIENIVGNMDFSQGDFSETDLFLKHIIKEQGYHAFDVRLMEMEGNREVVITGKACPGTSDCCYKVAPAVSKALGQAFNATGCICGGKDKGEICTFRLYQGLNYDIETGVAAVGREGHRVSGDSYSFAQLAGGKFAAIISDGMGSGEKAAAQSSATVAIIKRLMDFGFDMEAALKTVNSILMLRLPEETFCTVDMTVINLYTGQAEIIKIASPPSYLIKGKRVSQLKGSSLPVGIINDIEVSTAVKKLVAGDVLVMVTDGIVDSHRSSNEKEDWLPGVLGEAGGSEPGELAGLLLDLAVAGDKMPRDDMTAMVIKLIKQQ